MWPFMVPIAVVGFISLSIILTGPLGRALAERIGRSREDGGELRAELRGELQAAEQRLHDQIMDLEERLDFTERLVGQRHDRELPLSSPKRE